MSPQNNRRYGPDEYPRRLRIFLGNKRHIEEHNAGNHSFQSMSSGPCLATARAGSERQASLSKVSAFSPF